MIYEYALEPALVVDWAIANVGRYVGQFGLDHRRLVSDFPKEWRGRVVGEFYERFGYDDTSLEFQNAQPYLDSYLQLLTDCMVYRGVDLPHDADWLNAAILEHRDRPFYAIFASARNGEFPRGVISEKNVDDIRDLSWWLPTIKTTRKSAAEIAVALSPILRVARQICIVDPYFDANGRRFRDTFSEIVQHAVGPARVIADRPSLTLVTGVDRDRPSTEAEIQTVATNIAAMANRHLPRIVPAGLTVRLVILKNAIRGDPMHNRFVITDAGAVVVPYGLDDYDREEQHSAKDDLLPMLRGMFEERRLQYVTLANADVVLDITLNGML